MSGSAPAAARADGPPAKVLVVQSRPYQAFAGGDGAYIDGMVRYLRSVGCDVQGITSGTTKGRPRPWLQLAYPSSDRPWRFRATIQLGRRYLALSPQLVADSLNFIRQRVRGRDGMLSFAEAPDEAERRWIAKEIDRFNPDLAIFCFEAAAAADLARDRGISSLALVGFLPQRGYRLGVADDAGNGDAALLNDFLAKAGQADFVGFNSQDDRWFARESLSLGNALFVGMGFEEQERQSDAIAPVVLFVGNKTGPNREAAQWFIDEIWPRVRTAVPAARFRLVGRIGAYFEAEPPGGIECIGPVESLAAEYCGARLVVAPLRSGSAGVKTKVAEAISYGCPVVVTSLGVDADDRGQIDPAGFVADDPAAFAQHVIDLLRDDALWEAKRAGTRTVFRALFSREAAYRELGQFVDAAVMARGRV